MSGRCVQLTALLLTTLAASSLGIGIANVISVYYLVYSNTQFTPLCQSTLSNTAVCPYRNVVTLSFIGSGIWGSLTAFAVGVLVIRSAGKPASSRSMYQTALFVTAVVVLPTMIVLNAVNAALVTNESAPNQLFSTALGDSNPTSGKILLALPITVGCLGFLEMVVMGAILYYTCACFRQAQGSVEPTPVEAPKPAENNPPQTQPAPPPQPSAAAIEPPAPAGFYPVPAPAAYSPYGPLPYRRPIAFAGADYGRLDPMAFYRPALRSPYMYPPSAARYPLSRPYPLSYVPPSY